MKAITTKYHGPTNTRGSRITASDLDGNRITVNYQHELGSSECHRAAAAALLAKMGWAGHLIEGAVKDANVYVFCDVEGAHTHAGFVRLEGGK